MATLGSMTIGAGWTTLAASVPVGEVRFLQNVGGETFEDVDNAMVEVYVISGTATPDSNVTGHFLYPRGPVWRVELATGEVAFARSPNGIPARLVISDNA